MDIFIPPLGYRFYPLGYHLLLLLLLLFIQMHDLFTGIARI